ncbi:MAG: SAM-dependent methyltransferase, partial [Chloroflexota bacterium]
MPASITIAGAGPGDPGALTRAVADAYDRAERIILRTAVHPSLDIAGDPRCESCDDLYTTLPTFDAVYAAVVDRVIAAARNASGEIVYAVPGHPFFGERTVPALIARARREGIPLRVLPAASCVDAVAAAVGADPMAEGLQLLDGLDLQTIAEAEPFSGGQLTLDPARPVLVFQVHDRRAAAGVKLRLARTYPDEHPIVVVTAA